MRSALFVQAAVTALFSLANSGAGTGWTLLTLLVAAGAVFLGAALQGTPAMRNAVLAFEGVAAAFGVLGVLGGHYVPGTVIGIGLLIRLANADAGSAFLGLPTPAYGVPASAAPVPPAATAADLPPATAVPTMTILPD
ncbi:MAG: hypothetical protein WCD35_01850 [Mycobacteriales bacterium]